MISVCFRDISFTRVIPHSTEVATPWIKLFTWPMTPSQTARLFPAVSHCAQFRHYEGLWQGRQQLPVRRPSGRLRRGHAWMWHLRLALLFEKIHQANRNFEVFEVVAMMTQHTPNVSEGSDIIAYCLGWAAEAEDDWWKEVGAECPCEEWKPMRLYQYPWVVKPSSVLRWQHLTASSCLCSRVSEPIQFYRAQLQEGDLQFS